VQTVNPTANAAANAATNPPADAAANAAGNVTYNAANAAGAQPNVAANQGQNSRAQPPPARANHAEGSQCRRVRDEVKIAHCANYDCDHGIPDALDGRSNPSIWLKMYSITTRASGGNEDHMAGYFPS
jgi:hypothetical protein